jgi:hypothetical protein
MRTARWLCTIALVFSVMVHAQAADGAADLLPLHSKWDGTEDANQSHADSYGKHCTLTITRRDGDKFRALYDADGNKLRIEGIVNDDGTLKCIPIEVLHGVWEKNILKDQWTGKVDGKDLVFERWVSSSGGTKKTSLTRSENAKN